MSPIKIFHTADLHIGAEVSYLGAKAEERRYEALSVFKNIVAYCINSNVEICLIAGDLFDSNSAAAEFAPSVFEYMSAAKNVRFFYVAGNHDPLDAASAMQGRLLPENLHVFGPDYETAELPEYSLRIVGRSFSHSSMETVPFTTVFPDDGTKTVLLLHADAGADKSSPYNPIDRDFIENSGADYLALGHIHKRTSPAKFGKTTFAYPGTPEGHGFDEDGVKGGYLVTLDDGRADLSFVRLCRRVHRIEKVDISAATSSITAAEIIEKKLLESYGAAYPEDLYKIILTGYVSEGVTLKPAEILANLKDKLYFVKIKDATRKAYNLEALKSEVSLKGVFVKRMLAKIEAASENDKPLLESALYIGLSAFDSEVTVNED